MSTVNVSFITVSREAGFGVIGDIVSSENVTSSGTSAATSNSATLGAKVARISTDGDIRIAVGTAPTATTSGLRVLANTVEYISVEAGEKIAVIDS